MGFLGMAIISLVFRGYILVLLGVQITLGRKQRTKKIACLSSLLWEAWSTHSEIQV